MRKRDWFWFAAALLVIIPMVTTYIREYAAIDACNDAGGSFNYKLNVCDMTTTHETVPFGARHMGLLGITLMVLLSLAIARYVKWRRRLGE